jgi:hypothetical protein
MHACFYLRYLDKIDFVTEFRIIDESSHEVFIGMMEPDLNLNLNLNRAGVGTFSEMKKKHRVAGKTPLRRYKPNCHGINPVVSLSWGLSRCNGDCIGIRGFMT